MYCDNCGCELNSNDNVCPVCGNKIERAQGEPEQSVQPDQNDMSAADRMAEASKIADRLKGQTEDTNSQEDIQPQESKPENFEPEDSEMPDSESETTVLTGDGHTPQDQMMPGMNGQAPQGQMTPGMNGQMPQGQTMPGMNGQIPQGADFMVKKKGEKKKMGTAMKAVLITIPILIVAAVGLLAYIYVPKFRNYNDACAKLESGEIEEAVQLYKDLGDFKDSLTRANGGAYYEYAQSLEKDGKKLEAAEYYSKAAGYKYDDAADKASQCYYNAGMDQMTAASYDAAIDAFTLAGAYSDAEDKITECKYKKAETLVASASYDEAIKLLTELGEYSDSEKLLGQCYYEQADAAFENGSYEEAYELYMKSEYEDYSDKANECVYQQAAAYQNDKEYEKAIDSYGKVSEEYKDCTDETDACYSALGSLSYKEKNYQKAIEYFESVKNTDVSEKIVKCKVAYIKANKSLNDDTTMTYLGELRYAGNETAEDIYDELVSWDITSYVNSSVDDYDTQANSIKGEGDIYIHTSFTCPDDESMKIEGYIVYADGTKSDTISFSDEIVNDWITYVKIVGANAPKGVTYLYLRNVSTGSLIEVYPFTIE